MRRTRIKLFSFIVLLILVTNLSYQLFLFKISNEILKTDSIEKIRYTILFSGLVVTVVSIFGALLISFLLTRWITSPIGEMIKAAKAISKRDFERHIKISTFDEIEELVHSFNDMTEQLKKFKQETKRRSQNLEKLARKRARELSYIYKIGREAASTLELDEVLDMIVKSTAGVLDLKVCTILLVDETYADKLKLLRANGINQKKLIDKEMIRRGEGISGWVWDRKEALLIKDIEQDPRFIAREKERYYTGSLISAPLETKGKIIGIINGNNKTTSEQFKESDLLLLKEIATESAIAIENALLYKNLKEIYVHTISALASALEAKDHYAKSHSENVTKYAVAISNELGLDNSQLEVIRQACQLHDLGKIGTHDYILTKTEKLSPEEWEEIKQHSLKGAQILQPIGFLSEVADLVMQHHERFDGKGYPLNLSGQDILLGARIMAIADAFDAMLSERPYRQALSFPQAIAELKANSGTQFDPEIVKIFLQLLETNPDLIKREEPKNKE